MKYIAIYYKEITEEEKRTGKRNCITFGYFTTKKDAVKITKERFQKHEAVKDCICVEIVRLKDYITVFEMTA